MKTIRGKISKPFLIVIIAIPLAIMLFFNIAMVFYMNLNAKKEMSHTIDGIEILIKQQVIKGLWNEGRNDQDALNDNLLNLRSAIRLTKLAPYTEFLIVSGSAEVLFPTSFEDSRLNTNIVQKALDRLPEIEENEIINIKVGLKKYYVAYQPLINSDYPAKIVFISAGMSMGGLIHIINLVLFSIVIAAISIGTVIALHISGELSRPITKLSEDAKRIGRGEFLSVESDNSSVELYNLTVSMNEMCRLLSNHDQTQKRFLQNASHELRTPLMSIQGYAEGILKGVFPDTGATANIIWEESHRLNTLVEELLTLSRIENSTYRGEFECHNLNDMAKEYLQKINGYVVKEGKTLELKPQSEQVYALIVEGLLTQAVINILSNCIKYAKEKVTVEVYSEAQDAIIRISDDGNGIPEDELPHVFERFFKGSTGNFGLGLSIALSAVEYMGGHIKVYNNNGAVFEIQLPLNRN